MRSKLSVVALAALALAGFGASVRAADSAAWQAPAHAWVASHARRVGGQAPRDRRQTCEGDLNGDGQRDVAVVYTIEGIGGGSASDWTQYVTIMTSQGQSFGATLPIEIGGKGKRIIERCTVANGGIVFDLKTYAPEDAACCPSRSGRTHYAFKGGVLTDVPAPVPSGT